MPQSIQDIDRAEDTEYREAQRDAYIDQLREGVQSCQT